MQFAAIYKKFLNSRFKGFTKLEQAMNIQSVGWCETKPAQLKSPGRYSSFPFPHLSPLGAPRALPLFQASQPVRAVCGASVKWLRAVLHREKWSQAEYRGPLADQLKCFKTPLAPRPGSDNKACALAGRWGLYDGRPRGMGRGGGRRCN